MKRMRGIGAGLAAATLASMAVAEPTITSLGSGTPIGVSNLTGGKYYVSGSGITTTSVGRWAFTPGTGVLTATELGGTSNSYPGISVDGAFQLGLLPNTAPQYFGNTATGVSPVFSTTPALVASTTTPSASDTMVSRWSASSSTWTRVAPLPTSTQLCFGQSAGGVHMMTFGIGSGGLDGEAISQNGRFVAGHGYISSYSTSTGNTITASVSRWHPMVWDANTNTTRVLPTAARTGSATWQPRKARAYAVSNDGSVVFGIQEHNSATTPTPDPDGGRPLVWRWNTGTNQYDMSYLPTGTPLIADSPNVYYVCCTGTTCSTVTSPSLCGGTVVYGGAAGGVVTCTTTPAPCASTTYACCNGDTCTVVAAGTCANTTVYTGAATGSCSPNPCRLVLTTSGSANPVHFMNAAGTMIAGRNVDDTGSGYICKWTWDAGTSTWNTTNIGTNVGAKHDISTVACPIGAPTCTTTTPHNLSVNDRIYITGTTSSSYNGMWQVTNVLSPTSFEFSGPDGNLLACGTDGTGGAVYKAASWLPGSVYFGCGASSHWGAAPSLTVTGMSDDGSTIVGSATYSTCGSFMTGGWIWHASDNTIQDWYDYCVAQSVPGVTTYYAPIDVNANPVSVGLPRLGNPTGISADGTAIVGRQGGTQIVVPSAGPWLYLTSGGAACVPPSITTQPTASVTTSLCASSFGTILNVAAAGTGPFTYQWYRNTGSGFVALNDGPTGTGSSFTGTTSTQLRLLNIRPTDVGTYHCVVTGCTGQTATTIDSSIAIDSTQTTPANNDCANAVSMGEETKNFNICAAWANQGSSCATDLASVWYRYTPTFTGNARFQTCASTFDTTIQLYDTCNGTQLANGCNDDVGARGLAGIGAACSTTRSVISSFAVTSGVPIYVRVGAKTFPSSTTGSATSGALTISQVPAAPANDLCANAIPVTGNSATTFNLNEATDDFNIGVSGDNGVTTYCAYGVSSFGTASNRDVWFLLDTPCHQGGTYTISTCGSTITNPMLHVFTGTCDSLILLGGNACADNVGSGVSGCTSQQARITNLVTYGPVYIRVAQSGTGSPGTAATSGAGTLTISGTDNITCGVCCRGATCSTAFADAAACAAAVDTVAPATVLSKFVPAASVCNTPVTVPGTLGNTTTPCCYANYNHNATLEVQDIFDFLNDWFAGKKAAIVGGDGATGSLAIANIFDFLNAWFAGGCN